MKREDIEIFQKVVPHSKSMCGSLDNSYVWKMAKEINQPYLFVYKIDHEKIVLKYNEDDFGDFFLPEDFELYIESNTNQNNNNESRNIKMKKSELNSSMLFKMRNDVLYALLPDIEGDLIFYDKIDIAEGYSGDGILLDDYSDNLFQDESDDYDIVAIKQRNGCARVISDVLNSNEPEEWDWVEEVAKQVKEEIVENTVQNITINITIDSSNKDSSQFRELINGLSKYATQCSKV